METDITNTTGQKIYWIIINGAVDYNILCDSCKLVSGREKQAQLFELATDAEAKDKWVTALNALGVTNEEIEEKLGMLISEL